MKKKKKPEPPMLSIDVLREKMFAVVSKLHNEEQYQFPISFALISRNGGVLAGIFGADEIKLTAEYFPHQILETPLHVMYCDPTGKVAQASIVNDDFSTVIEIDSRNFYEKRDLN